MKKTDAVGEDDPHLSEAEEDMREEQERPSKADLEGPEDDADVVTSTEDVSRTSVNFLH